MDAGRTPVTIVSGPLGAGKTTLLNHLLGAADGRSIAVLVNDVGEINLDAELLQAGTELDPDGGIAELSNGCICCERQDDLETEVARLAREREFDHLVVEASGISEPEPIARLFSTESRAAALYEVDTTVTVVDGRAFADTFDPDADGPPERETAPDADRRPLSDLLLEQVEFSDVVVVNKRDLLSADELDRVASLIEALRPTASIRPTTFGAIDPDDVLGTGAFDPRRAGDDAGWKRAFDGATGEGRGGAAGDGHVDHADHEDHDHDHDHDSDHEDHDHDPDHDHDHRGPADVYGVTSFAYRRERPLHPGRFRAFLESLPDDVVRAKGRCWVAGREDAVQAVHVAGPSVRVEPAGRWIASLPGHQRDLYRDNRPTEHWDPEWGDREVRLVFIGVDLDESTLVAALDECLATDDELDDPSALDNPFPEVEDEALVLA